MTGTHVRRPTPTRFVASPTPNLSRPLAGMHERLAAVHRAWADGRAAPDYTDDPINVVIPDADVHLRFEAVRYAVIDMAKFGRLAGIHVEIRGFHQVPRVEDVGYSLILRSMIFDHCSSITYRALYPLADFPTDELTVGKTRVCYTDPLADPSGLRAGRVDSGVFLGRHPTTVQTIVAYFTDTHTSTPAWSGQASTGTIANAIGLSISSVSAALRRRRGTVFNEVTPGQWQLRDASAADSDTGPAVPMAKVLFDGDTSPTVVSCFHLRVDDSY